MKKNNQRTKLSKFISLILRHDPGVIGINLDVEGWADTEKLIDGISKAGHVIDLNILENVVKDCDKQRFCFNAGKTKIRANQGHSLNVDIPYRLANPPDLLYHGTIEAFILSIMGTGLQRKNRMYVHLSDNIKTAESVGKRRGKPVILSIEAAKMSNDGYKFYLSDNDVWLTKEVPVKYISILKNHQEKRS